MNEHNTPSAPDSPAESHASPLTGAVFWIAILFSAYQIWMAAFHPFSSQVIRALHVGFVLLMIFALFPPMGGRNAGWRALGHCRPQCTEIAQRD